MFGASMRRRRSAEALPQHRPLVKEGPVETVCTFVSAAAMIVMLVVIGLDIFTRAVFNYSFEISDEVGGYMLVLITFVSLPVCQVNNSFHHVEFLQMRLPLWARALSRLLFDLLALACGLVLLWQAVRMEIASFQSGDAAPTRLATPLWVPRAAILVGAAALDVALIRTAIAHARRIALPESVDVPR